MITSTSFTFQITLNLYLLISDEVLGDLTSLQLAILVISLCLLIVVLIILVLYIRKKYKYELILSTTVIVIHKEENFSHGMLYSQL